MPREEKSVLRGGFNASPGGVGAAVRGESMPLYVRSAVEASSVDLREGGLGRWWDSKMKEIKI